jgi:hypothetical protein
MSLDTDPGRHIGLHHDPDAGRRAIMDPSFTDGETDYAKRLGIVKAEMILTLTDALGDEIKAKELAGKFLEEFLAATAITLDGIELRRLAAKATEITKRGDGSSIELF